MKVGRWHSINVVVGKKFFGGDITNTISFMYCGMPNKDTFSMAYGFIGTGSPYTLNLYFPKSIKEVSLCGAGRYEDRKFRLYTVQKVTPEELILEFKHDLELLLND